MGEDDTPTQALLKATITVLAVLLLFALLSGCGAARRYELRTETVTLVYNSDAAGSTGAAEPIYDVGDNGACWMRFVGPVYEFGLWKNRGYSGTGCLFKVGTQAEATLIFIEGDESFGVLGLRWLQ
jgi:hypothetical protein